LLGVRAVAVRRIGGFAVSSFVVCFWGGFDG
jgi:hypothetical protein